MGSSSNTQSEPSPPLKHQPAASAALANQETPTANHPQFDLDAKMEKMAPLKFPETFGSGKGSTRSSSSMNNKSNASSSCRSKPSNTSITSHPSSKAFDSSSRPNKKSRWRFQPSPQTNSVFSSTATVKQVVYNPQKKTLGKFSVSI